MKVASSISVLVYPGAHPSHFSVICGVLHMHIYDYKSIGMPMLSKILFIISKITSISISCIGFPSVKSKHKP